MGDLPESRDWGGGEGGGEWGTVRERETYYSLEVKDVVGGEGLPRVEGCSMGALSNLRFFLCRMVGFVLVIVSLL